MDAEEGEEVMEEEEVAVVVVVGEGATAGDACTATVGRKPYRAEVDGGGAAAVCEEKEVEGEGGGAGGFIIAWEAEVKEIDLR